MPNLSRVGYLLLIGALIPSLLALSLNKSQHRSFEASHLVFQGDPLEISFVDSKGKTTCAKILEPDSKVRVLVDELSGRISSSEQIAVLEVEDAGGEFAYLVLGKANGVIKILEQIKTGSSRLYLSESGQREFVGEDILEPWGIVSVAPRIRLAWKNSDFVGLKHSRQNDLSSVHQLQEQLKNMKYDAGNPVDAAPPELAETVLDLYYSGNEKQARDFYNSVWASERAGKVPYWNFIFHQASKNMWWKYAQRLNSGASLPQLSANN